MISLTVQFSSGGGFSHENFVITPPSNMAATTSFSPTHDINKAPSSEPRLGRFVTEVGKIESSQPHNVHVEALVTRLWSASTVTQHTKRQFLPKRPEKAQERRTFRRRTGSHTVSVGRTESGCTADPQKKKCSACVTSEARSAPGGDMLKLSSSFLFFSLELRI